MALFVTCSCGKKLSAKDALAGKKIKCPKCGAAVRVPQPSESESGSESDSEDASDSADESESDAAPAKAKAKKGDESEDESSDESSDAESSEEERPAKKGLGRGRLGTARRKRTAATVSRDAAAAPAGESFFAGLGFRILGGIVILAIVLLVNLFTGSAAFDASFDKVQNGMARQAVVDLMGKPEVTLNESGAELLGFEAVDRTGRRSSKHTFYFVILRNGTVESKKRMDETEFNAMVGRKR